jgi:formate hydrogenlyase subunit 3/multisubunit Na+/H+ antiporter MnhD subunit
MNAPQIWILIPLGFSILIFLLRKNQRFALFLAGGLCAILAVLALTVKIGQVFPMGPINLEIDSTFSVLGRSFILEDGDRILIALIFGTGAVWFFGSRISLTSREFIPNGLAIIALMTAAFSVQPFLYSALIIEIAVLISVPMLVQPAKWLDIGISRYLIFQTLAMPFILLAGWGFEQAAVSSNSAQINIFAAVLLGFGFSLWLAVFPFYTWVPLLAETGHPFAAAFIFAIFPTTVQLTLVDFMNSYAWLRSTTVITAATQLMGIVMVVISGIWAAFHKSLLRLFGYLVLVEIGFSLIAFSINTHIGWEIYFSAILPRLISIALCALSISILRGQQVTLHLDSMRGQFYQSPIAIVAFLTGWFSLSGFPLFACFPLRLALLMNLSETELPLAIWALLGMFGLFFASFRMISVFFSPLGERKIGISETPTQAIFLGIGILVLIAVGLFPSIYNQIFPPIMEVYKSLP